MLRRELDYCVPLGLPHSQFLAWDPDDQDKALAWKLIQGQVCQRCGTLPNEWLDEEGYEIDPPPYVVRTTLCGGCLAIERKRQEIPQDSIEGISMYFERVGDVRRKRSG